jgi:hypothetical protein
MSCYGNIRYWISAECFYLKCPSVFNCARERNKNRKEKDLKDNSNAV